MDKRKFYKTTIVYEVLSEEPITQVDLADIAEKCDDGDCVGQFKSSKCEPLTPEQTVKELYAFGSEPEFFDLEEYDE